MPHSPPADDLAPIPRSAFRADAIPARDRFGIWSESVAPLFRPHLAHQATSRDFSATTEVWKLGETLLALSSQVGLGGFRSTGSGPRRDNAEVFVVQLYLRGGYRGHNGAQALDVEPGDISLLDCTRPLTTVIRDSELLTFIVPREALLRAGGYRTDPIPRVISGSSPAGFVLSNAFLSAWKQLPHTTLDQARAVDGLLLGAVAGLLRDHKIDDSPSALSADQATFDAIRGYIERNLSDPALTPDQLCKRFACSRARLYRMFAHVGGVADFIRNARLTRCYSDLFAGRDGVKITDVALGWGFGNFSHFCRLFRATFGVTPSEVVEKGRAEHAVRGASPSASPSARLCMPEYGHWIEQM